MSASEAVRTRTLLGGLLTLALPDEWRVVVDGRDEAEIREEPGLGRAEIAASIALRRCEPGPTPIQHALAYLEAVPYLMSDPLVVYAGPESDSDDRIWTVVVGYRTGIVSYTAHALWITSPSSQCVAVVCNCLSGMYGRTLLDLRALSRSLAFEVQR